MTESDNVGKWAPDRSSEWRVGGVSQVAVT